MKRMGKDNFFKEWERSKELFAKMGKQNFYFFKKYEVMVFILFYFLFLSLKEWERNLKRSRNNLFKKEKEKEGDPQ